MYIKIKNCNNIKEGDISVEKNKLNIKYGINGTGKSTIALAIEKNNNLSFLKTFGINEEPSIEFSETINKVVTFNSDFVNNIVFNGDIVINNAFEVFIKSDQYDEKRKKILEGLKSLNKETIADENTKKLIEILSNLEPRLKLKSTGDVYQTSDFKSILNKQNIYQIPNELESYSEFLCDKDKNINWIDWKTKGFEFDDKKKCPFCTESLKDTYSEEKKKFKDTFKKNDVKHLTEIKQLIEELKDYMNTDSYDSLQNCIIEPKNEDEIMLVFKKFIADYKYLLDKFMKIINFDSYNLKNSTDISNLGDIVLSLKIKTENITYFGNELFFYICNTVNTRIDKIIEKIEQLKAEVGAINGIIKTTIEKSKKEINDFLEIAGFDYKFDIIVEKDNEAKTLLKYSKNNEQEINVDNIEKHLSWGEKNAFALVLFMFYALSQKADLIILDDPISSFDGNKKYAIIDRLFSNTKSLKSLRNKTVLMLTHDFEPVIDFVINGKPNNDAIVKYIKNINGSINENTVTRDNDIKLSINLYYTYAKDTKINIISRISFLRKYIELSNVDNDESQNIAYEILSCLIHGRTEIERKVKNDTYEKIPNEKINLGISFIRKFIMDFDYIQVLEQYYNKRNILNLYKQEQNNYLKSQIFRAYLEISNKRGKLDDVVLKFVDEIYHIENDYSYSLDLIKFDTIPNFIIKKIDSFINCEI